MPDQGDLFARVEIDKARKEFKRAVKRAGAAHCPVCDRIERHTDVETPVIAERPQNIPDEVSTLFLSLALSVQARGFARYSARAILHQIRWHYHVERGDPLWKCNDHWTPTLARWAMKTDTRIAGFFELRALQE